MPERLPLRVAAVIQQASASGQREIERLAAESAQVVHAELLAQAATTGVAVHLPRCQVGDRQLGAAKHCLRGTALG